MHQVSPDMAKKLAGGRRRKTKKAKKGGYYGFSGALGTGAPAWSTSEEMDPSMYGRGGNATGGRRKRKGSKKTRKTKRGGGSWGGVAASFTGTGSRGLGDYAQIPSGRAEAGVAKGGQFNDFGAKPGDFSSFK
jgi:hypothetical protein